VTPTLVLGIGNILLRDEGVGVRVIEALRARGAPDGVEVVDGGTFGPALVDVLADRERVVVVDAVEAEGEPGTLFRFGADDLAAPAGPGLGLHDVGLPQALDMARQLGCAPREVVIIGIKPGAIEPGLDLTPAVAAAVPKAVDLVLRELGAEGEALDG